MSLSTRSSSPPKRPRLSLQIKDPQTAQAAASKSHIDPASPTAFNTLSNAYAAAIENSSPRTAKPPLSLDIKAAKPTSLRLETKLGPNGYLLPSQRTQPTGPFAATYPDTPSSALPNSTPTTARLEPRAMATALATASTYTPPQSAGTDQQHKMFTFSAHHPSSPGASSPRTPRRRAATVSGQWQTAPYTHPRSLRSILRNSPLPPPSSMPPSTPSRSSLRIANRTEKKVGYNDPLEQTITTNKYVKSHIELLAEDSPFSATAPEHETDNLLDQTLEYTGDETRDGGHTPGPFEEMRRRMADSELVSPAQRKRRRREKKRNWEWTITNTDEEEKGKTPVTAIRMGDMPPTPLYREASVSTDSEMSEAEDPRHRSLSVASSESQGEQRPGTSHSL